MKQIGIFILSAIILLASCGGGEEANAPANGNDVSNNSQEKAAPDAEKISPDVIKNNATANNDKGTTGGPLPLMTFEKDVHDFGDIIQGEKKEYNFKFTNTGKIDLVITDAKGSCGCTVPEYPKTPIAAGASEVIKVVFDSKGKQNTFEKVVTITANTEPNINQIRIKGNVIVPKGAEKKAVKPKGAKRKDPVPEAKEK